MINTRYVYVFDFGDMVKIGVSMKPLTRLKQLEKENGTKVVRTFAINGESMANKIECIAHSQLKMYLLQGNEYFGCSFATARDTVVNVAERLLGETVIGIRVGSVPESQKRATAKYNKKAYDRLDIFVKKGERKRIKEFAKNRGQSTNQFVNEAIYKLMEDKE